ncbi:hypothetical protein CspeluHIS016_0104240 [Cutaneotrichosporon spelunceum]|uniref:Uncharacterized protein n=1 Tax=Cutaneotrichosporon spelunceum TaxID=1672016 RepID=A0AAD3TNK5_9TREE|nr:hypothetical protein CspeluHIS016_0104240 [Cutaneotrichosporon spelunceum]
MVISSARDFTALRNRVLPGSEFVGVPGTACPTAPDNGPPQAFLINSGSAGGTFQGQFVNGEVQHIICINPPPHRDRVYKPWWLTDAPEAIAARAVAAVEKHASSKLGARVADSLVAYQHVLLSALDRISNVIAFSPEERDVSIDERLAFLEQGNKELRKELATLHDSVVWLADIFGNWADDRAPLFQSVYNTGREHAARGRRSPVLTERTKPTRAKQIHAALWVCIVLAFGATLVLILIVLPQRWRQLGNRLKARTA